MAPEEVDLLALGAEARAGPLADILHDPEHPDQRCRVDRDVPGLVVEGDIAAGHRDTEELAPSASPGRTDSRKAHMTPGPSGEPKLRQSVTASGRAPGTATLR